MSKMMRGKVSKILEKHHRVIEGTLGQIKATEHRIDLKLEAKLVRQEPYRAGPDKREIRKKIESQLDAGVI